MHVELIIQFILTYGGKVPVMKEHPNKGSGLSNTSLHLSFIEIYLCSKTVSFIALYFLKYALKYSNGADKEM
jgi:hypothetical protein